MSVSVELILGDCLDVLKTLDANSIDSIVCDPPYGLSFMGKDWDHGVPGVAFWEAALRVAKPGAMLLAFGGTRTFHRLTVAIEDAGWEIRDCLMWLYGSGFPKSHDISKAIDKAAGIEGEWVEHPQYANRNGNGAASIYGQTNEMNGRRHVYKSTSEVAQQFNGWGTALKPAYEPIIMAMKPLDGTFANNALVHGVAGLNIDQCRIGTEPAYTDRPRGPHSPLISQLNGHGTLSSGGNGRWPANLLLDEEAARLLDEEAARLLDEMSGALTSGKPGTRTFTTDKTFAGIRPMGVPETGYGDTGGASRFFYCAKASKRDRDEGLEGMELREAHKMSGDECIAEGRTAAKGKAMARNHHPTVKPTALCRYLVRLVTPPGGTVLDPFLGSGSTLKAATIEGFDGVGIELDAEYLEIARRRIEAVQPDAQPALLEVAERRIAEAQLQLPLLEVS